MARSARHCPTFLVGLRQMLRRGSHGGRQVRRHAQLPKTRTLGTFRSHGCRGSHRDQGRRWRAGCRGSHRGRGRRWRDEVPTNADLGAIRRTIFVQFSVAYVCTYNFCLRACTHARALLDRYLSPCRSLSEEVFKANARIHKFKPITGPTPDTAQLQFLGNIIRTRESTHQSQS